MKKSLCKLIITLSIALISSAGAKAQYFYGIADSGSKEWMSIKGAHYRVIFPAGSDSLAHLYLNSLEGLSPLSFEGSGAYNAKRLFPVVLHTDYMLGNGLVTWAPKRMELNTMAPIGSYPQLWHRQLALHESRHVAQMRSLERGFIRALSYLTGESATGIAAGLYPPKWFLEGDAVVAETENSKSGRGRQASFLAYYRAALLQGESRSWNRWRFGSYKDYTPDHYALGYLLNTTARMKRNNPNLGWDIIRTMRRNFYNPLVRDYSFRKVTGYTPRELMKESEKLYTEMWREELQERGPADKPEIILSAEDGNGWYSAYISLTASNDSTLYLQQESSRDNPRLIKVELHPDGAAKATVLAREGNGIMGNIAATESALLWNRLEPHPRWSGVLYSNLFCLNLASGKISRITSKSYLENPRIATLEDGEQLISAIELHPSGESAAVLLTPEGKRRGEYRAPQGYEMKEALFTGDSLYCTMLSAEGIGLYSRGLQRQQWHTLIAPQNASITKIAAGELNFSSKSRKERIICFVTDAGGVSDIYGISLESGIVKALYRSKFGCNNPTIAGSRIYMTEMTLTGADLVAFTPDATLVQGEYRCLPKSYKYQMAESLSAQVEAKRAEKAATAEENDAEQNGIAAQKESATPLPQAEPYRKGAHLFRFHSWAPLWTDPDRLLTLTYDHFYEMVAPGATLLSQNSLGTATTILGYSWHRGNNPQSRNLHAGHFRFRYTGLYPVFELNADINSKDRYRVTLAKEEGSEKIETKSSFMDSPYVKVEARTYIPLIFNNRGTLRGIIPQISYKLENNRFNRVVNGSPSESYRSYDQLRYTLQLYIMRPTPTASIYPRLGAGFMATYSHSLSGSSTFTPVALLHSYWYLPGLAKNHSIRIDADYQRHFTAGKTFLVDNIITFPRGYSDDFIPKEIYKLGASYAIPVHLGDLDLGFFAYIKRLQLIPFADFAQYRALNNSRGNLFSFGADALVEGHFFRIGAPVKIGIRYARRDQNIANSGGRDYCALLFNIDFGN